jgi:beta-glucosidase
MSTFRFPPGFLWGASISSHQVEGDNYWNDWWEAEQAGRVPFASGPACRHYELFEQDFNLARVSGHNAHRFSIEWSRIEPAEERWNEAALQHYAEVIGALRNRNLEPVVTLHHFTNPAWFSGRGGWLRSDSPELFGRYVKYVTDKLGDEVKYWITINEPTVLTMQGYINGEWPPFLKSAWRKAITAFRNLARAHVVAYRTIHENRLKALVGFAHSSPVVEPCNRTRIPDRIAAALRDFILNRSFFCLIKMSPLSLKRCRTLDFLGINYYTRTVVRSRGIGLKALLGEACRLRHHVDDGPVSSIGWEVYPIGLEMTLKRFSEFGIPLLITENGIATDDENLRSEFIRKHIERVSQALSQGIPVIGYLYWSLIDNFEWTIGTAAHFGLTAVNFETQRRNPRPCVQEFERICRANALCCENSH